MSRRHAPSGRPPHRFRHPRSLRGHDEGRRPRHLPGGDAGRHLARRAAARRAVGLARTRRLLQVLPGRHDLPRRRRSRRRVGAPAARGRGRRLPVRRPRQRRAVGRVQGAAAAARRRTDRAPLRPADREPHVRGARPVRAGGGVAGQGHRRSRRSAARSTDYLRLAIPDPVVTDTRGARRSAAGRPVRQPDHQHRPAVVRPPGPARRGEPGDPRGRPPGRADRDHLRGDRARRGVQPLREHRTPGDRGQQRRARPRRSASGAAPPSPSIRTPSS